MQKAEIELNIDIHIPLKPNSGIKINMYAKAPQPSINKVYLMTFLTNLIMPDRVFKLKASCMMIRSDKPRCLPANNIATVIIVITPKPPI